MLRSITPLFILSLIMLSCTPQNNDPASINGVWTSIGSGWLLEIRDSSTYHWYDHTPISCLSNSNGVFNEISPSLTLKADTLYLLTGVMNYAFTRTNTLPTLCSTPTDTAQANDPLHNFEVFAATVKEHYAFMKLNHVDWEGLYQGQKKKLLEQPNELVLYQCLEEILDQINDNHAFLEADEAIYAALDNASEPTPQTEEALPEYGDFQVANLVTQHHLEAEMTEDSWLIQWGKLADSIGYAQIKAMWLYADLAVPQALIEQVGYVDAYVQTFHAMYEGTYINKEVAGAARIMSRVMNDLSAFPNLVIDIRFNGGGQDAVSFEILRHLITGKRQVATQKLQYGGQFSPTQALFIEGKDRPYEGAVYVLTSPQTGSAAEAFSIATLDLPKVKRIGSATSGALSTSLEKTLPNGWAFAISNEVYMDNQGKSYENKGIPVDHELHYPSDRQTFFRGIVNDLAKDKAEILRAITTLQE
ncbi:MAG: S41 family peptidase [Bacteroidota bacterium]